MKMSKQTYALADELEETLYFLEDDEFLSMMESIEYLRVLERVPK